MHTEQITESPSHAEKVLYEKLQVRAVVINFTSHPMVIKGSDLSWGKWMQSPVDVGPYGTSNFSSQGRDSSPSGTEGWATWSLGGATIHVTFSCPLVGSNGQSITCKPESLFTVGCTGTGGDVNSVVYEIRPV
jgi:hypothetical protein